MVHQGRQELIRNFLESHSTESSIAGEQGVPRERWRHCSARNRFQGGRRDDLPLRQDEIGIEPGLAKQAQYLQVSRRPHCSALSPWSGRLGNETDRSPFHSVAAHKRLRTMASSNNAAGAAGSSSQDCSICLNSIAVSSLDPRWPMLQMILFFVCANRIMYSRASRSLLHRALTHGISNVCDRY